MKNFYIFLFLLSNLLLFSTEIKSEPLASNSDCLTKSDLDSVNNLIEVCLSEKQALKDKNFSHQATAKLSVLIDLKLAQHYAHSGNSEAQLALLAKIGDSPIVHQDNEIKYQWLRQRGAHRLHNRDFKAAKGFFLSAYRLAQTENQIEWLAKSSNDMGLINHKLKDFHNALEYYKTSLQYKEKLGNFYFIGTTLNNLGLINKAIGDFEQATEFYEKALASFIKYTEQENFSPRVFRNLSHLYEDLVVIYTLSQRTPKIEYFTQRLLDSFDQKFSASDQQRAFKNLAYIYVEMGDSKVARQFLEKAINTGEDSARYLDELAFVEGKIYYLEGDFNRAKYFGKQALLAVQESGNSRMLSQVHRLLFHSYLALNESKEAMMHLQALLNSEEKLLRQRYEANLGIIKEQIKNEQLNRSLIEEQLENQKNHSRIQGLTNQLLLIVIFLIGLTLIFSIVYMKKRKEKEVLLANIASHREKLLLLSAAQEAHEEVEKNERQDAFDMESFRSALVEVMIDSLALWEKTTQSSKIELAEQSKIWKVSIDSGRLRTRSLDKYLNIAKLPANPRWKNVVRSAHFVLSECALNRDERQQLNIKLNELMAYIKQLSLEQAP